MNHGFERLEEHPLPEYRATGVLFRHEVTGTEVYHVRNDDPENLFGFAFKTIPPDSTGVAHILEHSVLCGSRHFPLKDPFILLVKGSLNTFLNAMTYPDKTIYPASSTVERDLLNIMRVYGDAVFFPLLQPELFRQEGHRLVFDGSDRLSVTGIVYNEMKGVYANHDSIAARWAHRSLLPDTPYGHDSGGDPAAIPDLTYEAFVAFHRSHYHPTNARIFLYGDVPTERYLELLDRHFLSGFDRLDIDLALPVQPRWTAPRRFVVTCPSDDGGGPTSITVSWLLGPVTDPDSLIAHEMLSHILLGSSAGPLRRTLIESGLGEDLSAPTGLETDLREMIFSAGLRGARTGSRDAVEPLVLETLETIVSKGLDPDIVEATFRKVEFRSREIKGGGPNGLRLMSKSLRGWLHGTPPDLTMRFERPFEALRARVRREPGFFEQLIRESLLSNAHRATVTVEPDPRQREREQAALAGRLASIKAGLTEADVRRLQDEQAALERLQSAPDSPEAVASVPFLRLEDLPREVERIPTRSQSLAGVPCHVHEIHTNGIVYVDFAFDLSGLDPQLQPYVPLYTDSIGELGLPGMSYDEVATRIGLTMGAFTGSCEAGVPLDNPRDAAVHVVFRMRALESTVEQAVDLVTRLLMESDFSDARRIEDLVKEGRSGMAAAVLPSGHQIAAARVGRAFSEADRYQELWHGASQLLFIDQLSRRSAGCPDILRRINSAVIRRGALILNLTCAPEAARRLMPRLERFVGELPSGGWERRTVGGDPTPVPRAEALIVPSDVSYVATACRGSRLGMPGYVHEEVLAHVLRTGYLWETIRMKGGAYGANASARGMDEVFGFWSYRDPQITATLEAFRSGLERLAASTVDDEELRLAVIGVTGHHLRPLSPGEKGMVALRRLLYRINDELRQANRDQLLRTSARDVRDAAARLVASMADSRTAVVAGAAAIEHASGDLPELVTHRTTLPV